MSLSSLIWLNNQNEVYHGGTYVTLGCVSVSVVELAGRRSANNGTSPSSILEDLTQENTRLCVISPIGYFKYPVRYILYNWGVRICSLTLLYPTRKSPIPDWVYYPKMFFFVCPQLGIIWAIRNIFC